MIYLYLKQHSITKLKYFGRTTSKNPFKYKGSGKRWGYHCRKHGWEFVNTIDIWGFDNQEECTEFALNFSYSNNIVESLDFANLEIEDGKNSRPTGVYVSNKTRIKHKNKSPLQLEQLKSIQQAWIGRKHNPKTIEKMKKPKSEETKKLMRKPKSRIVCSICGKEGPSHTMNRYHKH